MCFCVLFVENSILLFSREHNDADRGGGGCVLARSFYALAMVNAHALNSPDGANFMEMIPVAALLVDYGQKRKKIPC